MKGSSVQVRFQLSDQRKGSACLSDIPFLYPAEMPVIPSLTVLSTGHLFFLFFDHFLDHIPPTDPFCLEVKSPLYPSDNGTPSSLATSYLNLSSAPFASGTLLCLMNDLPYSFPPFL